MGSYEPVFLRALDQLLYLSTVVIPSNNLIDQSQMVGQLFLGHRLHLTTDCWEFIQDFFKLLLLNLHHITRLVGRHGRAVSKWFGGFYGVFD